MLMLLNLGPQQARADKIVFVGQKPELLKHIYQEAREALLLLLFFSGMWFFVDKWLKTKSALSGERFSYEKHDPASHATRWGLA